MGETGIVAAFLKIPGKSFAKSSEVPFDKHKGNKQFCLPASGGFSDLNLKIRKISLRREFIRTVFAKPDKQAAAGGEFKIKILFEF